jgi:hypothetical protein
MSTKNLVGMWTFISDDIGYNAGCVIAEVGNFALIELRAVEGGCPARSALFSLERLEQECSFFSEKDDLEAFMTWLETPSDGSKPKVVSINGEKK